MVIFLEAQPTETEAPPDLGCYTIELRRHANEGGYRCRKCSATLPVHDDACPLMVNAMKNLNLQDSGRFRA